MACYHLVQVTSVFGEVLAAQRLVRMSRSMRKGDGPRIAATG